jgi:general secretion pathway protein L
LPEVAEENLSQALEYEMGRHIPFRREDIYYDFLRAGKIGNKIGLLVFVAPRRGLDEILDILSTFGIKPRGVETTVTALSNYLLFCTGGIEGPAVVIGKQEEDWELIGLANRGNGWTKETEIAFAHWLRQAEWMEGAGREIFCRCLNNSPKLFGWGYTQDFLRSVNGGDFQFEDLFALGKERYAGEKEIAHSLFLPALGVALRGIREASFPVNLLPGSKEEVKGKALSWINRGLAALLALGLCAWGASYPFKDEIRLRQLQGENQKLVSSVNVLRTEEEELGRLREQLSFLTALQKRRGEFLRVLEELSRTVPNTAYVSNLRFRDGGVELQGNADSASNLVPLLERSPLFKSVGFNAPSNRGRDNRETFSLKAELEQAETKAAKQ